MDAGSTTIRIQSKVLTSPNQPKIYNGKRTTFSPKSKFDFSSHGFKHGHRKSNDRHKQHQLKMLFNNDPLNLASLCNKVDGRDSPETSSPVLDRAHEYEPANVLPIDVKDPLNLNCNEEEEMLTKPPRKRRRRRRRNTFNAHEDESSVLEDSLQGTSAEKDLSALKSLTAIQNGSVSPSKKAISPVDSRENKLTSDSKIVKRTSINQLCCKTQDKKKKHSKNKFPHPHTVKKQFNTKNQKYVYGNYSHYYSGTSLKDDQRLHSLKREWFCDKICLDVGCNTGKVTQWIAEHFSPKSITGIDIDHNLIRIAKRTSQYHSYDLKNVRKFPLSLELKYGPLLGTRNFSKESNISFVAENYVPSSDLVLNYMKDQYDTIVCLSVTKWVQLNYGDSGLKRVLKKIYLQLKPGGRLVFEPHTYASYKKKKNLTETTRKHFDEMTLMPTDFISYLLSPEVGFATSECLCYSKRKKSGFDRPLYLLTKGGHASL